MNNQFKTNLKYIKDELNKTEKNWKKEKIKRFNRISGYFNIPDDCVAKSMLITVIGCNDIQIDNYGKIEKCSDSEIILCNEYERIYICGSNMKILCYTPNEIAIRGIIGSININK